MKKNTSILITGVAGFIGFHVAECLLKRGDTVVGIDNLNDYYDPALKKGRIKQLLELDNFSFHKGSIEDREFLDTVFQSAHPDTVIHLAAQAGVRYSFEHPEAYISTNIVGFHNVLDVTARHGIKNFVFASSSSVYGDNTKIPFSEDDHTHSPRSLYGATKKAGEALAYSAHVNYDIRAIGLRFFTVYGPWGRPDMAYYKFTKAILAGEPIDVYNNGKLGRDFTYIDDIVQGVVAAADSHYEWEIINLGNDQPVELMDFIAEIEKTLGKKAKKHMIGMQPGDVYYTHADISKAKKLLGYNPKTPLSEGVRKFIEWYVDYRKAT